jgi:ferredoxin
MKRPVIDVFQCVACDTCTDRCPAVFQRNEEGTIQVVSLAAYPQEEVDDIIKKCIGNCIAWKESNP